MIVTREEAIENKDSIYFDGEACSKGHLTDKYVSTGACIECCKEFHTENLLIKNRMLDIYRKKQQIKEKRLDNQHKNFKFVNKRRQYIHKCREYIFDNDINFDAEDIEEIYEIQQGECAGCFTSFDHEPFEVDHKVPIALGGDNSKENIQLLCRRCNRAKRDKPYEEWISKVRHEQIIEFLQEVSKEM